MTSRCDVAGCPKADDHFPIAQLILPLDLGLAAELLQAFSGACDREGLQGVAVDLPDHGNGRLYARGGLMTVEPFNQRWQVDAALHATLLRDMENERCHVGCSEPLHADDRRAALRAGAKALEEVEKLRKRVGQGDAYLGRGDATGPSGDGPAATEAKAEHTEHAPAGPTPDPFDLANIRLPQLQGEALTAEVRRLQAALLRTFAEGGEQAGTWPSRDAKALHAGADALERLAEIHAQAGPTPDNDDG